MKKIRDSYSLIRLVFFISISTIFKKFSNIPNSNSIYEEYLLVEKWRKGEENKEKEGRKKEIVIRLVISFSSSRFPFPKFPNIPNFNDSIDSRKIKKRRDCYSTRDFVSFSSSRFPKFSKNFRVFHFSKRNANDSRNISVEKWRKGGIFDSWIRVGLIPLPIPE